MSLFNIIVLLFYAAAMVLAIGYWRPLLWLFAGAASYAGTVIYWNAGLPSPEIVAGVVDFTIALAIFILADKRWEIPVFVAFQFCLLVNFMHSLGLSTPYAHAVVLELANIAIALFIGGVFAFGRAGYRGWANSPWLTIFGLARPFRAPNRTD